MVKLTREPKQWCLNSKVKNVSFVLTVFKWIFEVKFATWMMD